MISMWDVLKASKGLPVSDFYAAMWGKQIAGKYTITELEGTLPMSIVSAGKPLMDYRIYGAEGGVGVETESGEPTGYKLPMITEQSDSTTITPVYIGGEPLDRDEYVSFSEQKIYRLGENIADWSKGTLYHCTQTNNADGSVTLTKTGTTASKFFATSNKYGTDVLGFKLGSNYLVKFTVISCNFTSDDGIRTGCCLRESAGRVRYWDTQPLHVLGEHTFTFTYDFEGILSFLVTGNLSNSSVIIADFRVQEITEEDPPVPLPEIPTLKGSMTLDCEDSPKPEKMYIKYLEVKND